MTTVADLSSFVRATRRSTPAPPGAGVTWPEFGKLHPSAPADQAEGYRQIFSDLERWLAEISGLHVTTLQPAAGAHGELTGLLVIRAAHLAEGRDPKRIIIPDTAKEKPQEGEVVAVGPGRIDDNGNRVPVDVAVGDKVIYSKYGGTEVKYAGEDYLILSARDLLAVVG